MGMSSGSSSTQSTQPYIMSGPSLQAAQLAAQAQVNAAQIASQAATQNTNTAINALMNEYSTSLQYANPTINTGNQAAAQMNYMMGLPAINPGPAPTAPTAPTLAQAEKNITLQQLEQAATGYISDMAVPTPGAQVNSSTPVFDIYNGPGAFNNVPQIYAASVAQGTGNTSQLGTGRYKDVGGYVTGLSNDSGQLINNPANFLNNAMAKPIKDALTEQLGQQYLDNTLTPQYKQQTQAYDQQNNQWNQQEANYNKYNAMGTASPQDIANIVTNLPGFQFSQEQGINQIQNAASASGMLNSGSLLRSLDTFGQQLSQQYYQNYMGNLSNLAGMGTNATNAAMGGANLTGAGAANQYANLGNTQANAALAAGQAMASSYLTPVANQQVIMTPYTTSSSTSGSSMSGNGMLGAVGALFGESGGGGGILGGLL